MEHSATEFTLAKIKAELVIFYIAAMRPLAKPINVRSGWQKCGLQNRLESVTVARPLMCGERRDGSAKPSGVQQRRWQTMVFGDTQRHTANSIRHF